MPKNPVLRLAERWKPDPDDPFGEDQAKLVQYLLASKAVSVNPVSIPKILQEITFARDYTRNTLQHRLVGPLRKRKDIFIGWNNGGLFLVTSAEDADAALATYTARVRAELHHARNLKALAKRTSLFDGYISKPLPKTPRAVIFIDESGTPSVTDLVQPFFIVAAVIIESREALAQIEQRFANACAIIKRPVNHELRSSGLSAAKHRQVLNELSPLDYQWAAVCFVKEKLSGEVFQSPREFYKYALQFLVDDLLSIAWSADLVLDEYSTPAFQKQVEEYLRRGNSGMPVYKLNGIGFSQSQRDRLIQLADLVAGAVRRNSEGQRGPLKQILDKQTSLRSWPPE